MVVVERELVRATLGNAVNNWYYDDPLIGFSAHDDSLLIEGCDGSGIRRYDRSAELETYPIADMDSEPFRKHTQVAVSRDPGTYAIWDVDTGLACRYHPPICTARMHKSIIETTSPNDRFIIADQDVRAIANAGAYAFAPIGHVLAVQYEGSLRICDFDHGTTTIHSCSKARRMAFSPDAQRLAIAEKSRIRVLDVVSGDEICSLPHKPDISSVAWSGEVIAIGDFAGLLTLWSPKSTEEPITIEVAGAKYTSLKPLVMALGIWVLVCLGLVLRAFHFRARNNRLRCLGEKRRLASHSSASLVHVRRTLRMVTSRRDAGVVLRHFHTPLVFSQVCQRRLGSKLLRLWGTGR